MIEPNAQTYVIDDAELQRVRDSYPCIWKDPAATPKLCFVGCPHMTIKQLKEWTRDLAAALQKNCRTKVSIPTVFTTAPAVQKAFEQTADAQKLRGMGVVLSYICPLMYMNNPICGKQPVITNSNKLRTYTTARYHTDAEILELISKGGK